MGGTGRIWTRGLCGGDGWGSRDGSRGHTGVGRSVSSTSQSTPYRGRPVTRGPGRTLGRVSEACARAGLNFVDRGSFDVQRWLSGQLLDAGIGRSRRVVLEIGIDVPLAAEAFCGVALKTRRAAEMYCFVGWNVVGSHIANAPPVHIGSKSIEPQTLWSVAWRSNWIWAPVT